MERLAKAETELKKTKTQSNASRIKYSKLLKRAQENREKDQIDIFGNVSDGQQSIKLGKVNISDLLTNAKNEMTSSNEDYYNLKAEYEHLKQLARISCQCLAKSQENT